MKTAVTLKRLPARMVMFYGSNCYSVARCQVIGAMTMGVGAALMEEFAVDKRLGFFVSHDLAGYRL